MPRGGRPCLQRRLDSREDGQGCLSAVCRSQVSPALAEEDLRTCKGGASSNAWALDRQDRDGSRTSVDCGSHSSTRESRFYRPRYCRSLPACDARRRVVALGVVGGPTGRGSADGKRSSPDCRRGQCTRGSREAAYRVAHSERATCGECVAGSGSCERKGHVTAKERRLS